MESVEGDNGQTTMYRGKGVSLEEVTGVLTDLCFVGRRTKLHTFI